jgi:hypothetical protein
MSLQVNNITRVVFAIFFLWMLELPGIVQAENKLNTKTVVVISTGKVQKENTAKAREEAIANGLVSAVDMVALELLPLESLIAHFQKLNEVLHGQTGQFIQDFKVLSEFPSEHIYRVMVEATVTINRLKELLSNAGIVLDRRDLPSILFLISEQNIDDTLPQYWWGKNSTLTKSFSVTALAETMIAKGFPVIDSNIVPQKTTVENVYDKPNLNNREAVDLGLHLQAEIVIVGEAVANKMPNVMGESIRTFKGTVNARAIRTDTGTEIATITKTSVKTNTDEFIGNRDALFGAGTLAGQELASQIVAAWQKEGKPPNMIEIKVEGAGNLSNLVKFRRIVKNIPGVKDLQMKEMTSNEATMMVGFQGSAKELANALMLETIESIGINIYEVSQNHLRIALIPG